jgi:hypothetical protein
MLRSFVPSSLALTLIFSFSTLLITAQSLPIDFEGDIMTSDFIDFDGGVATVVANPSPDGTNGSATVARIVRDGGQPFGGSKLILASNLDFSTLNTLSMKVYTAAPVGTIIKFKLEGAGSAEVDVQTTVTNAWETLKWDFTGTSSDFNTLVFMFDFGNVGDGSAASTFFFDDVEQLFGGTQIDLPVTFEDNTVNYTMTDFEGNASMLVADPTNPDNNVMQVMKTPGASASGGTTIGTPAGFATDIPLTLTDSKMTVRVWTPNAGTPVRLKVEDSNDPTRTCETQTNTTVNGGWETLVFDFTNEAPGTELLSVGLSMGWTYNMASIFFNFGTDGAGDGGTIYYFDDVGFGDMPVSTNQLDIEPFRVFPNPAEDHWTFSFDRIQIQRIDLFDVRGIRVATTMPMSEQAHLDASNLSSGTYLAKLTTPLGVKTVRVVKR